MEWKGQILEQMASAGELSRVWIPCKEEPSSEVLSFSRDWRRRSTSVPISVTPYRRGVRDEGENGTRRCRNGGNLGGKGGKILSSLLQLVSHQWVWLSTAVLDSLGGP